MAGEREVDEAYGKTDRRQTRMKTWGASSRCVQRECSGISGNDSAPHVTAIGEWLEGGKGVCQRRDPAAQVEVPGAGLQAHQHDLQLIQSGLMRRRSSNGPASRGGWYAHSLILLPRQLAETLDV